MIEHRILNDMEVNLGFIFSLQTLVEPLLHPAQLARPLPADTPAPEPAGYQITDRGRNNRQHEKAEYRQAGRLEKSAEGPPACGIDLLFHHRRTDMAVDIENDPADTVGDHDPEREGERVGDEGHKRRQRHIRTCRQSHEGGQKYLPDRNDEAAE